jgi:hypothetical protein
LTVTPDATDLYAEIAACWKVSWKVEPAPLSVPLAAAADDEVAAGALVAPVEELDELELEEQAARRATATAPPTVATYFTPRSCISGFSLWV